jgi:hypothetical protein
LFLDACGNCGGSETAGCTDPSACNFDASAGCDDGSCFFSDNCDDCPASVCDDVFEAFDDGNFTESPVWSGDEDAWQVVSDSDVAEGADCSLTLRLNVESGSGTKYLSTSFDDWQLNQEWSYWLGRRSQAYTLANRVAFWLFADDEDLTSPTISGYRVIIGDNTGGDEFVLQRVNEGVVTDLLATAELPNGLQDIGVAIRVTRTANGEWALYTSDLDLSNGQGVTAASCPAEEAIVFHGNATDGSIEIAGLAYVGLEVIHSSGGSARTAVEFDNLSIVTDAATILGCTDELACNYDPDATEDDGTCDFPVEGFECGQQPGCTYAFACNYNEDANIDDGSCEITSCAGCTYEDALNYEPTAVFDDGSCTFPVVVEGCPGDLNNDAVVDVSDLIIFLGLFGTTCN